MNYLELIESLTVRDIENLQSDLFGGEFSDTLTISFLIKNAAKRYGTNDKIREYLDCL
jgi:hypothetical protein|tara:strand:- start:1343 stop:1516 length:174 start_codon:yes stop_codon:yes gene_type:complete